jgi:hypothetical protein
MNHIVLAHGIGGRSDLPVPLWMALYGAAAAVLVSFFALGAFWREPRFRCAEAGRALGRLQDVVSSRALDVTMRGAGVLAWLITLIALAFGDESSASNPAPTWFYVWFWVGLVPASILLGPVWRRLNPLRTVAALLAGPNRGEGLPYPKGLGYWPAAMSLAAFVWLELVFIDPSQPMVVLIFILLYSAVHVLLGMRFGEEWFERADGFEVYSTLLARLCPVGRRDDGKLVARNPLDGLCALEAAPGLVVLVSVVLGSTAFDGLTRTAVWQTWSQSTSGVAYAVLGTAGLVGSMIFVWATFTTAIRLSGVLVSDREGAAHLPERFVHSLIPIAVGYSVAHYFSLFVFQGQAGYILAADPFDAGWNLLGLRQFTVNYLAVSVTTIAWVQVLSIVVGHVVGVVAAHDRAVGLFSGRDKVRAQYPLLGVMVAYTLGGIFLLVGT